MSLVDEFRGKLEASGVTKDGAAIGALAIAAMRFLEKAQSEAPEGQLWTDLRKAMEEVAREVELDDMSVVGLGLVAKPLLQIAALLAVQANGAAQWEKEEEGEENMGALADMLGEWVEMCILSGMVTAYAIGRNEGRRQERQEHAQGQEEAHGAGKAWMGGLDLC